MTWTLGLWGLVASNLIYTLAGLFLWVGASFKLTQNRIWTQHCPFLIYAIYQCPYDSIIWHIRNDGADEYYLPMTRQLALKNDEFSSLMTGFTIFLLYLPIRKYNTLLFIIATCILNTCQSAIPGFIFGSLGTLIFGGCILVGYLALTYRYVVKTSWFIFTWISQFIIGGAALYFHYIDSQCYYSCHFTWHLLSGTAVIINVVSWLMLLYAGELEIYDLDMSDIIGMISLNTYPAYSTSSEGTVFKHYFTTPKKNNKIQETEFVETEPLLQTQQETDINNKNTDNTNKML